MRTPVFVESVELAGERASSGIGCVFMTGCGTAEFGNMGMSDGTALSKYVVLRDNVEVFVVSPFERIELRDVRIDDTVEE